MVATFRTLAFTAAAMFAALVSVAHAQTPSAEVDLTAGYSGEDIRAAASQLRVFGDAPGGIRYFAEASWAGRWAGENPVIGGGLIGVDPIGTDVFGAAYPYRRHVQLMEVYAERYFSPRGVLVGARVGRFRTPFGIYSRSDYGYSGFVRPPLIRYDGYFALSNNWLEEGAVMTAGLPQLFVEASVGRPQDVGSSQRRSGTDGSIRVQGYRGPLVIGASHARSNPYMPVRFARGRQAFTGIDARYASTAGIQVRGEAVKGHSYEGVSTTGWYVDGLVHRAAMGPVTAVIRGESLDYTAAAPFARSASRFTLGTRVRLPARVTTQINFVQQHGDMPRIHNTSVDFSVTYSIRYR
jgi:hypothetical protein